MLCHRVVPGAVVVEGPWFNTAAGETWVDAHLLPVPDASLDAMSLIAPGCFRGAVVIGRPCLGQPTDVAAALVESTEVSLAVGWPGHHTSRPRNGVGGGARSGEIRTAHE